MKELILKDFRLIKFLNIAQLIVGGIFTFVGLSIEDPFGSQLLFVFLIFLLTYVSSMFISVRESKTQGDIILNSLPVKKGEIVKARYLSMILYGVIIGGFILIAGIIADVFMKNINTASIFSIIFGVSLTLIFLSVYLPFQYYNIGKAQIFNALFYMILILIPNIFNRYKVSIMDTDFLKCILSLDFIQISIISFGLSLLLYGCSLIVSIGIYKNKEF